MRGFSFIEDPFFRRTSLRRGLCGLRGRFLRVLKGEKVFFGAKPFRKNLSM